MLSRKEIQKVKTIFSLSMQVALVLSQNITGALLSCFFFVFFQIFSLQQEFQITYNRLNGLDFKCPFPPKMSVSMYMKTM